jgi:hypothetical protein
MEQGSIGRTLRRGGAVSAGALFIALAGGGLSLAGAVPGSAQSGVPAVSSPHDGGVLHGTTLPTIPPVPVPSPVSLPVPLPSPAPAPSSSSDAGPVPTVTKTVHKTVKTVQGILGGGSGSAGGGSQGGSGGKHGGSGGSHPGTTGHQPSSTGSKTPVKTKAPSVRTLAPGGVYRAPMRRVDTLTAAAAAPGLAQHANVAAAGAPAAIPPQLAPTPSMTQPPIVSIGQRSLPAAIVAVAIAAFAALAASHIGVWQNRVRRSR